MEEYLRQEWRFNNNPRYQHLFDEWFKNITDNQKMYFKAYSEGKKTPYQV